MIFKNPRKIQFEYAAQNHKKEPINLSFSFSESDTYTEDLRMFAMILDQAKADVQAEIDAADEK